MKKIFTISLILILLFGFSSCKKENNMLNPKKPVTINLWHVYGELASSPLDEYIDLFNETIGKKEGIVINVTLLSNAQNIGSKLVKSLNNEPGSPEMPDLFTCHKNDCLNLGVKNLIDWSKEFSDEELANYIPSFVDEGITENTLTVFPISKSTHVLYISGSQFDKLVSSNPKVKRDDLATWEGFFKTAKAYHETSGKAFCAIDYLVRCIEINALSKGGNKDNFYTTDGWYKNDPYLKESFFEFMDALIDGSIVLSNLFSNTQVMTGDVISGISSTASILYYKDIITYPDNTTEPINLEIYPLPQGDITNAHATIAGVGFAGYKTTEKKKVAMTTFVKWFTEATRNLEFASKTGYVPANKDAFEKINDFQFEKDEYKKLFNTLQKTLDSTKLVSEPTFKYYYDKLDTFNDYVKTLQKTISIRYSSGQTKEMIMEELWEYFLSIK